MFHCYFYFPHTRRRSDGDGILDSDIDDEEARPIWKYSARDKIPPLIAPNTHEPFKESLTDNYIELREPTYKYTSEGVCKYTGSGKGECLF